MAPPSKVPVYPRPVSPLSAESFYLEPQDIIYATSQSSSDDDSSARAAKRRRVEKLGEQYLRGDGLHILSAGLKGPFDKNWKNPWANRRREPKRAVPEIPETIGKPSKKLQAQKNGRAKVGNDKVEEWLRRNTTPSSIQIDDQISPTPLRTKVVETRDPSPVKPTSKATDDTVPGSYRLESDFATHKATYKDVADSGAYGHNLETSPRLPDKVDCPLQSEVTNDARTKRRAWVSHAANADRAEFAALKSKRRVTEVAPSSTMLSPFEYRRSLDGFQKPKRFEEIADEVQAMNQSMAPPASTEPHNLHTKDDDQGPEEQEHLPSGSNLPNWPQAVTKSTSSAAPVLSTDTSRASVPNLPSAQPQSLDIPAPSTNNLAFEEQAPEQLSESVDPTDEPPRNLIRDETNAIQTTKLVDNHESLGSRRDCTPHVVNKVLDCADETRLARTITKEGLSTQDMLAAMSPLAFSTVKRPTVGFQQPGTPLTATKRRTEKSGRIASFAQTERISSDSSQGSLKASLRVTKGNSTVVVGKENKLSAAGKDGSSESLFGCFPRPAMESLVPVASPKRLKSALKSSGLPIQAGEFPSIKGSTSTGIDGGQNLPVLGDDTFDLDGAIDDLGSYLGTWDAEKEASSLGREG
jgi:hypothetical protein